MPHNKLLVLQSKRQVLQPVPLMPRKAQQHRPQEPLSRQLGKLQVQQNKLRVKPQVPLSKLRGKQRWAVQPNKQQVKPQVPPNKPQVPPSKLRGKQREPHSRSQVKLRVQSNKPLVKLLPRLSRWLVMPWHKHSKPLARQRYKPSRWLVMPWEPLATRWAT